MTQEQQQIATMVNDLLIKDKWNLTYTKDGQK